MKKWRGIPRCAPVTMEVAFARALEYMYRQGRGAICGASSIGQAIWPDWSGKSQGLGAAASRILKRMAADGLVEWHSNGDDWGYRLTAKGRAMAGKGEA